MKKVFPVVFSVSLAACLFAQSEGSDLRRRIGARDAFILFDRIARQQAAKIVDAQMRTDRKCVVLDPRFAAEAPVHWNCDGGCALYLPEIACGLRNERAGMIEGWRQIDAEGRSVKTGKYVDFPELLRRNDLICDTVGIIKADPDRKCAVEDEIERLLAEEEADEKRMREAHERDYQARKAVQDEEQKALDAQRRAAEALRRAEGNRCVRSFLDAHLGVPFGANITNLVPNARTTEPELAVAKPFKYLDVAHGRFVGGRLVEVFFGTEHEAKIPRQVWEKHIDRCVREALWTLCGTNAAPTFREYGRYEPVADYAVGAYQPSGGSRWGVKITDRALEAKIEKDLAREKKERAARAKAEREKVLARAAGRRAAMERAFEELAGFKMGAKRGEPAGRPVPLVKPYRYFKYLMIHKAEGRAVGISLVADFPDYSIVSIREELKATGADICRRFGFDAAAPYDKAEDSGWTYGLEFDRFQHRAELILGDEALARRLRAE